MSLNIACTSCKFTPLGFETFVERGTKHQRAQCKFTPLGFETFKFNINAITRGDV